MPGLGEGWCFVGFSLGRRGVVETAVATHSVAALTAPNGTLNNSSNGKSYIIFISIKKNFLILWPVKTEKDSSGRRQAGGGMRPLLRGRGTVTMAKGTPGRC